MVSFENVRTRTQRKTESTGLVCPVSLQLKTARITWSYKVTLGFFSYDWIDWGDVLYVLLFCINNIIYVAKILQQSNRASAPHSQIPHVLWAWSGYMLPHWQQIKGNKTGNVVPGQRADYTTNGINKQENKSHEEQSSLVPRCLTLHGQSSFSPR